MIPLILTGLALVLLGAALWCLRQMREVLHESGGVYGGGEGASLRFFLGAVWNGIVFGVVVAHLLEVLP